MSCGVKTCSESFTESMYIDITIHDHKGKPYVLNALFIQLCKEHKKILRTQ